MTLGKAAHNYACDDSAFCSQHSFYAFYVILIDVIETTQQGSSAPREPQSCHTSLLEKTFAFTMPADEISME